MIREFLTKVEVDLSNEPMVDLLSIIHPHEQEKQKNSPRKILSQILS
jgi:hypothetical protein